MSNVSYLPGSLGNCGLRDAGKVLIVTVSTPSGMRMLGTFLIGILE